MLAGVRGGQVSDVTVLEELKVKHEKLLVVLRRNSFIDAMEPKHGHRKRKKDCEYLVSPPVLCPALCPTLIPVSYLWVSPGLNQVGAKR